MSLFGTGRKEGVIAVCLIGLLVVLGHIGAAMPQGDVRSALQTAVTAALGGMLAYRYLRSQGRSRYAGFLCGAAYGLSPLFVGLALEPREQFAAALAPLALEAVGRCHHASRRRGWLPWTGMCLALPWLAGATVIATLTTVLGQLGFVRTLVWGDHSDERRPVRGMLIANAIAAAAAANFIWLDPLGFVFGEATAPTALAVLSGGSAPRAALTTTIVLRALVPFLVWFAVLGVLRRQRHVNNLGWLGLVILGMLPTMLCLVPGMPGNLPLLATVPGLAASMWWLSLLAVTVLAAAGLDDFLDQPMRHRGVQFALLAITFVASPLLPAFDQVATPSQQWVVLGTLVMLAAATLTWRRLGILRFKNALSTMALSACALPLILHTAPFVGHGAAMPLGEIASPMWQAMWYESLARPWWHYAGLGVGMLATIVLASRNLRRSR